MTENTLNIKELNRNCMVPIPEGKFSFACHPGVSCFTRCCADLDLALTPYDVLRLKNRLSMHSGEFLDEFTTDEVRHNCGLPVLMLEMNNDANKSCPFLQPDGCTVYEDRPGACRLYPVARAAKYVGGRIKEHHFMVKEEHCQGFQQKKEWTVQGWISDQGLEPYNRMNSLWMAINQSSEERATPPSITDDKLKMYFMACYNVDTFKEFVFQSRLLKLFDLEKRAVRRIQADESELLKFAFTWLQFALFGKQTMKPKQAVINRKKRARART
jgi:Fe-S-cluster containining protein